MKVKFVPQNVEFEITPEQTVKEIADKNGIFIKSICNGLPSCAECRVRIVEGDHNVLPPNTKELNLIGTGFFIDQRRLSCQIHCFGDVTVDLTEQVAKQNTLTARKPQGSRKTETETTHAVSGNLIQQENALFIETVPEQQKPRQDHQNRQNGRPESRPNNNTNNSRPEKNRLDNRGGSQRQQNARPLSRGDSQRSAPSRPNSQNERAPSQQNRNQEGQGQGRKNIQGGQNQSQQRKPRR